MYITGRMVEQCTTDGYRSGNLAVLILLLPISIMNFLELGKPLYEEMLLNLSSRRNIRT